MHLFWCVQILVTVCFGRTDKFVWKYWNTGASIANWIWIYHVLSTIYELWWLQNFGMITVPSRWIVLFTIFSVLRPETCSGNLDELMIWFISFVSQSRVSLVYRYMRAIRCMVQRPNVLKGRFQNFKLYQIICLLGMNLNRGYISEKSEKDSRQS